MCALPLRFSVLLSVQRALWDAITPSLRGVAVRIEENLVEGRMIYDHAPDAEGPGSGIN